MTDAGRHAVWPDRRSRSRSKFDRAGFLIFALVFVSRDFELGRQC